MLEGARETVAGVLGARPSSVVFTSGATESVHLAIRGLRAPGTIVATDVEHPAVVGAIAASGRTLVRLPIRDATGPAFEAALDGAALVTLPYGGHETGDLLPVADLAARAHAKGVPVHLDAAQALGRVPFRVGDLGADLASISAHKCGGPPGAGALVVRPGLDIDPLLAGGGQERGRRGGTEAWPLHVAFGGACEALTPAEVAGRAERMAALRDELEERALEAIEGTVVNGLGGPRLPNTSSLSIEGVDGHEVVIALDLRGFAVSSGSACASGLREPSPIVRALHPQPWRAKGAVRVSLGPDTGAAEIGEFVRELAAAVALLRAGSRDHTVP